MNKINIFRKGRCVSLTFLCYIILFNTSCNSNSESTLNGFTMGTSYKIIINEYMYPEQISLLHSNIDSILNIINYHFSTYIDSSEIRNFNKSYDPFLPSNRFLELFELSKNIYNYTNGMFDPTVHPLVNIWGFGNLGPKYEPPSMNEIKKTKNNIGFDKIILKNKLLNKLNKNVELDFSAIAKGFGVDVVSEFLLNKGLDNFMVEIGGEVYCSGKKNNNLWKIGIQNPVKNDVTNPLIKVLELTDVALATSGDYQNYFIYNGKKYSHTINPKTGYPTENNMSSVTVLANNCASADAFATGLMVLGYEEGIKIVEELPNIEAIFVLNNGNNYEIKKSSNVDKFILSQ